MACAFPIITHKNKALERRCHRYLKVKLIIETNLISQCSISITMYSWPSISIIAVPANGGQWPWMSRRVTFSHHMQSIIRRCHATQAQAGRSPKSWSGSLRVVTANSSSRLSRTIIMKTLWSSRISASSKFIMKTSNIYRSITRTTSNKEMTCLMIKSICICILIKKVTSDIK